MLGLVLTTKVNYLSLAQAQTKLTSKIVWEWSLEELWCVICNDVVSVYDIVYFQNMESEIMSIWE